MTKRDKTDPKKATVELVELDEKALDDVQGGATTLRTSTDTSTATETTTTSRYTIKFDIDQQIP